jgi:TrmH family RNA methyltransferase
VPVPQAIVSAAAWEEPRLRRLAEAAAAVAVVDAATMAALGTLESPASIAFLVPTPERADIAPTLPTVVLDRVQDPGNVGSVLRSAASFGFIQAIALVGTASLWSPKVVRAGMGAHFALRLVEGVGAASLAELVVPLLGTSSHATQPRAAARWSRSRSPAAASRSTSPPRPPSACTTLSGGAPPERIKDLAMLRSFRSRAPRATR